MIDDTYYFPPDMLGSLKTIGETNAAFDENEESPSPVNGQSLQTSSPPPNYRRELTSYADVSDDSTMTSFSECSDTSMPAPLASPSVATVRRNTTSSSMDILGNNSKASSALDGHVKSLPVDDGVTSSTTIPLGHIGASSAVKFPEDHPKMSLSPVPALLDAHEPQFGKSGLFSRLGCKLARVFSPRLALDELCSMMFWHDVIVETVLCMYYECLIIWISVTFNANVYKPSITHFGLYAGFFVFACIEGWGPLCGASVNPARTWSVFLTGRMTFIKALVYTIVEVGGAAAGTMIGYGLTPANATNQIIPLLPGEGVTAVMGMAIEAILTFNLIFVGLILGQPVGQPSAITSLTIGFCVGTGVMAAGTHTGGLQNPIVAFGPAIISGNFQDHWLYWVGPYVGSTVATVFYLLLKVVRDIHERKTKTVADTKKDEATREGCTQL